MVERRSISTARTIWRSFGGKRALAPRLQQPRHLHGDGRAAGDDVAARDELKRGARQRQRIDAGMRIEALVLVGEQQLQIRRIDIGLGVDRQPPAAVGRRIGAQQLAVAVDHRRARTAEPLASGSGPSETTQAANADATADATNAAQAERSATDPPHGRAVPTSRFASARTDVDARDRRGHASMLGPSAHFAARTSMVPVPVRP